MDVLILQQGVFPLGAGAHVDLVAEKAVVVGVGSLGSYVIDELAHAGYQNIAFIDDDKYEYANIFRHRAKWFSVANWTKSKLVEFDMKHMHPELNVKAVDARLTEDNIAECIPDDTQLIIFTVGSSDVQLRLNKALAKRGTQAAVYYAWLEHDGETSHVAVVKSTDEGCFECLFTDGEGELSNNQINRTDPKTLVYSRNGCGGTRVHYGNRTLLTASALLLKALQDNPQKNTIYSYYEDAVHVQTFPRNARCNCCAICK